MIAFDPTFDEAQLDPDTERMIRVAAGDMDAFDELIGRNFASTVRIITSMMGSPSQSEDLAQDVFLRIYRSRARYVPTAKFSTWLGTITRNVVLNAKRSLSRSRVCFVDLCDDHGRPSDGNGSALVPGVLSDPNRTLEEKEIVSAVSSAVAQLPTRQKKAVELVYFRGMTYAGAADEMDTTWKAVKSLLGRGRGTLIEVLRNDYQHELETA